MIPPLLMLMTSCGTDSVTEPTPEAYKKIVAEGDFVDPRDGHKYHWVRILAPHPGAEPIDIMTSNLAWLGGPGDSVYRDASVDSATSYKRWGVWYDWLTAIGGDTAVTFDGLRAINPYKQGVCPDGWVIFNDWTGETLLNTFLYRWDPTVPSYRIVDEQGGIYQMDTLLTHLLSKQSGGTDKYGFSFEKDPISASVHSKRDDKYLRDTVVFWFDIGMQGGKYEYSALGYYYDRDLNDSEFVSFKARSYSTVRCVRGTKFQ